MYSTPPSSSKFHNPYFTPGQVESLSARQRGKLSVVHEDRTRQSACAFIEAISTRIGFPRRTTATAQNLYHRFHLFFPLKDFNYHDVALAAIYVSSKMHDTLKKPRELLATSYALLHHVPKSKAPGGEVDIDSMDQQESLCQIMVENDRQRLLSVERLILETICFNFTSRMPFPYVIKLGKALGATKKLTKFAWRITIDCHRTLLPLQYPPHVVALGCIYVAAMLSSFEQPESPELDTHLSSKYFAEMFNEGGNWEHKYHAHVEDLQEIAHTMLDLLIQGSQTSSASTSPSTPSSPSPHIHSRAKPDQQQLQTPYKSDQLIRLKIFMRETEHTPRSRFPVGVSDPLALQAMDRTAQLGRNEGTVRFLFGPPGTVDDGV
ncbi:cyclin-like protein [Pleurotus eryngii]|uniref:Cyclin-like protein n=1 Tax=Pleurotus eryngii TaxID=5323 RepID=A0A9P6A676_PLEER|nr:cyclin-like protein [Pleurotus eryngii]